MIELIEDYKKWDELVSGADVFHLSGYARAFAESCGNPSFKEHFCGKPGLICYEEDLGKLVYPVMIREITGTNYKDLVSPYGYSGPYISGNINVAKWLYQMNLFCREKGIVSEFLRLNPFFLQSFPTTKYKGAVTCLDIEKLEPELIWNGFEKRCRNAINRAIRAGVQVARAVPNVPDKGNIAVMARLYNETMTRNGASEKYLFSEEFFSNLFKFLPNNSILFIAFFEGKPIAAATFLYRMPYFHYYLAGSNKVTGLAPNNLILWEAIKYAKTMGFKTFNFGGGVGGEQDKLKKFKQSFSKQEVAFHVMEAIHMPKEYLELCKGKKTDFFPAYRG